MNDITLGIALGMAIIYIGTPAIKAFGRTIERALQKKKFSSKEIDYIDLYA